MKTLVPGSVLAPLFAALVVVGAACSSTKGHERADSTGTRMNVLRESVAELKVRVKATTDSLSAFVDLKNVDPRKGFETLTKAVDRLLEQDETTKVALSQMKGEGRAYFAAWGKDASSISDEEIRDQSEERRAALRSSFDRVSARMDEADKKYAQFKTKLEDVRKFLSNDLTEKGIESVEASMKDIVDEGKDVQKLFDRVIEAIDDSLPEFRAAEARSKS